MRNLFIAIGVIVLMIITGICVNEWNDIELVTETTKRVISEEKIKQLANDHARNKKIIDSMIIDRIGLLSVIEYQKNNSQLIIHKYEAVHHDIDLLSPDEGYKLFTANINAYKANRKRYSLQRFSK